MQSGQHKRSAKSVGKVAATIVVFAFILQGMSCGGGEYSPRDYRNMILSGSLNKLGGNDGAIDKFSKLETPERNSLGTMLSKEIQVGVMHENVDQPAIDWLQANHTCVMTGDCARLRAIGSLGRPVSDTLPPKAVATDDKAGGEGEGGGNGGGGGH